MNAGLLSKIPTLANLTIIVNQSTTCTPIQTTINTTSRCNKEDMSMPRSSTHKNQDNSNTRRRPLKKVINMFNTPNTTVNLPKDNIIPPTHRCKMLKLVVLPWTPIE
jgi:hypothetical protein